MTMPNDFKGTIEVYMNGEYVRRYRFGTRFDRQQLMARVAKEVSNLTHKHKFYFHISIDESYFKSINFKK